MDDQIYVAFLVGVGPNSATFATVTHCDHSEDNNTECRVPSILSARKLNEVFYEIDRAANTIKDWSGLYRWLGREVGTWAAFPEESALRLVPHWFSDSVELICKCVENGPFIDVTLPDISIDQLDKFHDLTGAVDSQHGQMHVSQLYSNLVLTRLPIFIN